MAVPSGVRTVLATFSSLSDMCSFTVSPSTSRWYWHHEGGSQFGGSDESIGYCTAAFMAGGAAVLARAWATRARRAWASA
ncbi:MAG: hypothetical protein IPF99_28215 [Deltaproteobacteria bacterium]|nr:hypothetical protein [Deltaproteobacteria bacterium]